jgi:hypothetical protein
VARRGMPEELYGFQKGASKDLTNVTHRSLGGIKKGARSLSIKILSAESTG